MSPDPVDLTNGLISFDFTSNQGYEDFFGLAVGQKEITN